MLYVMVAGLAAWMFGCAYAGYHKRFGLFAAVLVIGMGLNTLWMVYGLQATMMSPPALTAHAGAFMYAVSALGFGWLTGRLARAFRESKVEVDE